MRLIQLDLMSGQTRINQEAERTLFPVKGFVPTPSAIVDLMVSKLFHDRPPSKESRVLDPGCGTGAFIHGIVRWCEDNKIPLPQITGVESNPLHVAQCQDTFRNIPEIEIRHADFLDPIDGEFDFIIGNPPYVPITELDDDEKRKYRERYTTAQGRFDLYLLFWEQALRHIDRGGRQVFITPEKFLYVETAAPLRRLLNRADVEEIHFLDEQTFGELVTYPVITTVSLQRNGGGTRAILRDSVAKIIELPSHDGSWLPTILGANGHYAQSDRLADVCVRISCGVATGADQVFVIKTKDLQTELIGFAYPTLSGRDIKPDSIVPQSKHVMLLPYDTAGMLLPESQLGALGHFINESSRRQKLLARTCVKRKPWYAFHENPPLRDLLRPKILCKDIGAKPIFIIDRDGDIIPRHTIYYIVPKDGVDIDDLADYLNSDVAEQWLRNHCQRAANGFLRLQSHILKELPIPA